MFLLRNLKSKLPGGPGILIIKQNRTDVCQVIII